MTELYNHKSDLKCNNILKNVDFPTDSLPSLPASVISSKGHGLMHNPKWARLKEKSGTVEK
jgi:hypothetical protein